ncbi:MAG: MFS transporter [Roseiarcus sp.]
MAKDDAPRGTTSKATASCAQQRIPAGVWALGLVSMFMDISSEMIHALLPVYMVSVLGASTLTVGVIEGVAEATAAITKLFSGALSDWIGRRKLLAALGYGLAALTKPAFPLATSIDWFIAARFVDRLGKGIRGAPRDALVADIAPPHLRGASFGLRQSLDTVGAFLGPLIAIGAMWLTGNRFRTVFWIAVVPAVLSVALIVVAVEEPARPKERRPVGLPLRFSGLAQLGASYWWVAAIAAVFTLARFSEAFLILRGQSIGLPPALAPAALVIMNIAYSVSSYPIGALSDRIDPIMILLVGLALLILADLTLAFAPDVLTVGVGVALWGLHMGFTQGLLSTLVAIAAPEDLRGTAFGVFNFITGLALLLASVLAGALWDIAGPQGSFLGGAGFAALASGGLVSLRAELKQGRPE